MSKKKVAKTGAKKSDRSSLSKSKRPSSNGKAKLLSGGNPQIAKGDGDAPVQAYLDALPAWKRDVGHRLDAIISRTVPQSQQGGAVEHAVLRYQRQRMVCRISLHDKICEGGLLPRNFSGSAATGRIHPKRRFAICTFTRTTRSMKRCW